MECIALAAIKCYPVSMLLDTCEGQDVRDSLWVVPYCSISMKVSYELGADYTSVAVDIHLTGVDTDVA